MFSIDSKICEKGSDVQNLMISYGSLFDELHIVVYTTRGFKEERIASNVFVYPTNTKTKFFYFWNAYTISKKIIGNWKLPAPLSADGLGRIRNFETLFQCFLEHWNKVSTMFSFRKRGEYTTKLFVKFCLR